MPGRPKGSKNAKPTVPRSHSLNFRLVEVMPGQTVYLEARDETHAVSIQRSVSTKSRYPGVMDGYKFTTERVIGVGQSFKTYHLVRITRVE